MIRGIIKRLQIMNIKNVLFPEFLKGSSPIKDSYIRIMCLLYPLIWVQEIVFHNITEKFLIYILLTFITLFVYCVDKIKKKSLFDLRLRRIDLLLILCLFLLIINFVIKISRREKNIEQNLFLLCLISTYFLLRNIRNLQEYYLKLILFSGYFVFIGLFQIFLFEYSFFGKIDELVKNTEGVSSYLILIIGISSLLFSKDRKKYSILFYYIMFLFGSLLLTIHGDIIGICIVLFFLISIPLFLTPTAALIKKNLILCVTFLFILSNVPLLQYLKLFRSFNAFNMTYTIYIDIVILIISIYSCIYWEKIPIGISLETIIMKKIYKLYKIVLAVLVGCLFICLLSKETIMKMPDIWGLQLLKYFCVSFIQSINKNESFYVFLLKYYGVIGAGIFLFWVIMIAKQLKKRFLTGSDTVKILVMISGLFLLETFFYMPQLISTPLYVILLSLALFTDNKRA